MTEYNNFDLILGASKSHILNYFGTPNKAYSSILVYKKHAGTLAITFDIQAVNRQRTEEVSGFVLYDIHGNLLYSKGLKPLNADQVASAETMQTSEDILAAFGGTHFDIGSGMHNYGYFTERGELFLIGNLSGQSHCRRIPV